MVEALGTGAVPLVYVKKDRFFLCVCVCFFPSLFIYIYIYIYIYFRLTCSAPFARGCEVVIARPDSVRWLRGVSHVPLFAYALDL